MTETSTKAAEPNADAQATGAATPPAEKPKPAAKTKAPAALSMKAILAAINDGDTEDEALIGALNAALYAFGAQDPSFELPRSWWRVQRRIGVEPDKLDGVATAEQVAVFADRAGLTLVK